MTRKEELLKAIGTAADDVKLTELIDTIVDLEERMQYLRTLPFIRVSKKNPEKQEVTPASKQYKELLQQYTSCLRLLFRITGEDSNNEEESPLRKWARERQE